jgi:hypothetical protein
MTTLPIEELNNLVLPHVHQLMEHFDAVQILATVVSERGTELVAIGSGNWYARRGMAEEFINRDRAVTEANEIAEAIQSSQEEG